MFRWIIKHPGNKCEVDHEARSRPFLIRELVMVRDESELVDSRDNDSPNLTLAKPKASSPCVSQCLIIISNNGDRTCSHGDKDVADGEYIYRSKSPERLYIPARGMWRAQNHRKLTVLVSRTCALGAARRTS